MRSVSWRFVARGREGRPKTALRRLEGSGEKPSGAPLEAANNELEVLGAANGIFSPVMLS